MKPEPAILNIKEVNEQMNQELRIPEREEWGTAADMFYFPARLPLHRDTGFTSPLGSSL